LPKKTTGAGKSRSVEEAVSYAMGHRIRIEVLAALNERIYSTADLSRILHQPLSTVTHHVEELRKSGSIEVARTKKVRNIEQNFYRSVELPFYSDEDIATMTADERQSLAGLILQASMAEAMASLWAGKLKEDPRVVLAWRWFNLDNQGREDLADEQAGWWERSREIEAESASRRAESGEDAESIIVTLLAYKRSRNSPHPPLSSDEHRS
jgi:DNA-binding transcriptional ArsR family regulator